MLYIYVKNRSYSLFKSFKKRIFVFFIIIFVFLLFILINNCYLNESSPLITHNKSIKRRISIQKPQDYVCQVANQSNYEFRGVNIETNKRNNRIKLLIITNNVEKESHIELMKIVMSLRLRYRREIVTNGMISMNRLKHTIENDNYTIVIIENVYFNDIQTTYLIDYCKKYHVGLIEFNVNDKIDPINSHENRLDTCKLNVNNDKVKEFLYLTKQNDADIDANKKIFRNSINKSKFVTDLVPVLSCNQIYDLISINLNSANDAHIVVYSLYLNDLWILKLLFIDSLIYASNGRFYESLIRYIQIDVDDMFVGMSGTRMITSDVNELIKLQELLSNAYFKNGFKFNFGFSGYYYQSGNEDEKIADRLLLDNKKRFNWFHHSWSHLKQHLLNESALRDDMQQNLKFSNENNIPIDSQYLVPPHHAGVYPVYETFYRIASEILSIKATSTEMYPHARPLWLRRGFIFRDIMVAPRRSSGLYTHTLYFDTYPGGIDKLNEMYKDGDIVDAVLFNRLNIFMTHMPNYANDRMANFLFKNFFLFISCWTNLQFYSLPPLQTVIKYFDLYTEDRRPVWADICNDNKSMAIWSRDPSECKKLPKFIIIGPQKTGTTALYTFLKVHPNIRSNKNTLNFEETQFFSDKNYFKGIDWYLDLFEMPHGSLVNFEKSANYFDDRKIPYRIRSVLKDVKLITLLLNPVERAYSWYQHMRFHNDSTALNYSFYEIITSNSTNKNLTNLKDRCLQPGLYFKHLLKWLTEFDRSNIFIIDADTFKLKPYVYLNKLQIYLELEEIVDYKKLLVYDKKKGFYCLKMKSNNIKSKCLGASKGHKYELIDDKSNEYLKNYYYDSNLKLFYLLRRYSYEIPKWLTQLNIETSENMTYFI